MATVVRLWRCQGVVRQDCDVYIGRACYQGGWRLPASPWANPYTVQACGSPEEAVARYEAYIRQSPLLAHIEELRGKRLGCWCKCNSVLYSTHTPGGHRCQCGPHPCHGDVLVRLLEERHQ
jgi:hypothetical protein